MMKKLLLFSLSLLLTIGCSTINIPPRTHERRCHYVSISSVNTTDSNFGFYSLYHRITITDAVRLYQNTYPNISKDNLKINYKFYDYDWEHDHPSVR